ncbi:MAG: hypothetical protein JNM52_06790, partial [Betaproteobacteria bacterium]|nr:hypothetical protein [Betaproteobacteria bacterium]
MTSPAESNPIGRTYIQSSGVEPGSLYLSFSITLAGGKIVGDDLFRLVSFEGQESVSEPYEFQLELHGNTEPSENPYPPVKPATTTKPNTKEPPPTPRPPIETIQFEDVIGRPITVALMGAIVGYQDETGASKGQEPKAIIAQPLSYFSGIVASFAMEIPGVYRIVMRPSLWRLTLTNRYRVYPQTNIQNLIRTLLKQHDLIEGRDFSVDAMQGLALARKQDWFQAGETDFEFLRRLMGKSHIYFYFIQTPSGHKVIFANYASYQPVGVTLRYTYTGTDELAMQQADVIFQYSYQQSLTSTGVRGVFARQDAAWEYDEVARSYSYETPKGLKGEGSLPFNQYKIYQYGGSVGEVSNFAQVTSEVLDSSSQQLSGASYCPLFHVGHFFTMTGRDMDETAHPYPVRPNLEGKTFVLTQVKHKASLDGTYQNEFQASIDRRSITPFSIQDTQQGVVMAVVLAHDGVPPNGWKYYDKSNFSYGTQMMSDAEGDQTELAAKGVYVRFSTDSGNEV